MPLTVSVCTRPVPLDKRSLSPTPRPKSLASSVPIKIDSLLISAWPCTIFSGMGMILKYTSGCTPTTDTDRVALPRLAKAAPETDGDNTLTCGIWPNSMAQLCHWSMPLSRCNGTWMCAISRPSPAKPSRNGRTVSFWLSNWMCAWPVSTRLTKFDCKPANSADMNTITATPMAMPTAIKPVCILPSCKNRIATTHSNGSQRVPLIAARRARVPHRAGWAKGFAPASRHQPIRSIPLSGLGGLNPV